MDGRLKHKDVEAEELEKKRLLDACRAVQTTTIERNSSKYRVDAKRMYREYTRLSVQRVMQPSGTLLRSVSNTCA